MSRDLIRMVALGDSIMYGQGLEEREKFTSLLGVSIKKSIGVPMQMVARYAHSSAPVGTSSDRGAKATDGPRRLYGEAPYGASSVFAQLYSAREDHRVDRDRIDLVLVSGGANDGAFCSFVNPTAKTSALRNATRKGCNRRMGNLLIEILDSFQNAKVVVTGYYPIFSNVSATSPSAIYVGLVLAALKVATGLSVIADGMGTGAFARLVSLSNTWSEESDASLQAATSRANDHAGETRVAFAPVRFGPFRSLFAPVSWLWGFGSLPPAPWHDDFGLDDIFNWALTLNPSTSWLRTLAAQDPVRHDRKPLCAELIEDDISMRMFCNLASLGHPNRAGARHYCEAVQTALASLWREDALNDTKRARLLVASAMDVVR